MRKSEALATLSGSGPAMDVFAYCRNPWPLLPPPRGTPALRLCTPAPVHWPCPITLNTREGSAMPTTVYTLLCQTDRTGYVLAVFTDRAHAAEVARANAATHAERLRRQDEKTFKAPIADDVYQVHVEDLGSNLTVFIRHRFLDEAETYRWLVDSFELVPHRQ